MVKWYDVYCIKDQYRKNNNYLAVHRGGSPRIVEVPMICLINRKLVGRIPGVRPSGEVYLMSIYMLVNWLKFLCIFITFCVRTVNFSVQNFADLSTSGFRFKFPDLFTHTTGSTLALYVCFSILCNLTIYHVPYLIRHAASWVYLTNHANKLVTMRLNFKFLAPTKFKMPDPYVSNYDQDSTLLQIACYNVIWYNILPNVLCLLRHI